MLIPAVSPRSLSNLTVLQRVSDRIGKLIPDKFSRTFEMNQVGAIERLPLVLLSFMFVLGARFIKSRDAHERREVLTRDGLTIGTAMLGVPVVKNWMLRGMDKLSKIPTATDKKHTFSLEDFGLDNLTNWYAKANMKPKKVLSIAENIKQNGGDVAVAFSKLGEQGKKYLNAMLNGAEFNSENILSALDKAYKAAADTKEKKAFTALTNIMSQESAKTFANDIKSFGDDVATVFAKLNNKGKNFLTTILDGAECTSENILKGLETASGAAADSAKGRAFSGLTNVLRNENGLVSAAQRLKAIPSIASVILITTLLGWGIPAFNIRFTRKQLKQNNKSLEPEINSTQKQIINDFFSKS